MSARFRTGGVSVMRWVPSFATHTATTGRAGLMDGVGAREERGRVAVGAHAEEHQIEARPSCVEPPVALEGLAQLAGVAVRGPRRVRILAGHPVHVARRHRDVSEQVSRAIR